MPKPDTRWRVSPPLGPGEGWSAVEFDPATQAVVSRVRFEQNGRAQATRYVRDGNRRSNQGTTGGDTLRNLLDGEGHKNMRQDDGNQHNP